MDDYSELTNYCQEPSREFLKFSENYLSYGNSDPGHNPSFRSCMVRIPGSINSKNGETVKIIQKWDGKRPHISFMLGSFMTWLVKNKITRQSKFAKAKAVAVSSNSGLRINWIEVLLKTPLDDYRKTIINLVLAPYLVNIRQIEYEKAVEIIKIWLEICNCLRKIDFNSDYVIGNALSTAKNTGYKPMRLDTLKARNPTVYGKLKIAD